MIRITKIALRNYRGIQALDADIPGAGVIARGRNGAGKSSVLNAIGAALASSDIGPEAVKIGEKNGEVLIDLDLAGRALHVRRRFTAKGSEVEVTTEDGDVKKKPATVLQELLGSAPLDVVSVVLETDKKRRKELILRALPVKADLPFLRKYVPALPDTFDVSGHGLEVIERLRAKAYESRTAANKAAKDAAAEALRLAAEAKTARSQVPQGAPPDVDAARAEHDQATQELSAMAERRDAGKRAMGRTKGLRDTADSLRVKAKELRAKGTGPTDEEIAQNRAHKEEQLAIVKDLEVQLEKAKKVLMAAVDQGLVLAHARDEAKTNAAQADKHDADADAIERGIAEVGEEQVSEEQVAEAVKRSEAARDLLLAATAAAKAENIERGAKEAAEKAKAAQSEADRLDAVVTSLAKDAPAALLAATAGVPSDIELDGDEVRLGGISLDRLCGAEKMVFAAEIAKALNPGVGFLVVDGMERLDPEQQEAFIAAATRDGRQLFGSVVDRGDLVLAHLSTTPDAAAAE